MPRRPVLVVLAAFVVLAVAAALVMAGSGGPGPSGDPGLAAADSGVPRAEPPGGSGGESEVAEEAELAAEREEALEAARDAGTFGTAEAIASDPAPGWYGEQLMNPKTDDWEPAVAADPKDPFLYLLTTRFGAGKTCASHCPSPYIAMARSTDNGATWKDQVPLCVCRGSGAQYDPTIEVVPNTGDVYSVFLNADRAGGFSTVFIRSRDHGRTWTDPVHVYRNSWTDKPEVTMSASGKDVYVSWNGQTGGDPWIGQSHDYGKTWTQTRIVTSKRYFYAYDADVLPDGTVVFAESSLLYTGGGVENQVAHHVILSRDGGDTWQNKIVDKVGVGESCVAEGCYADFYLGQPSIASDARGHLVYAYEGATRAYAPQRIYVSTSSDEGRTWSDRIALSTDGENATQPRVAAIGNGDVRLWYMQTSNGDDPDAWNVWYRSSSDGGRTWSSRAKISDATSGAGYKSADGFDEIYGDYGEIAITSAGKTFAAWGEAFSFLGPGGTWFNLQR